MKVVFDIISSTRSLLVLLAVFSVSMAVGTFIENDFGVDIARDLVYDATWFELILAFGAVNLFTIIFFKYKMIQKAKLTLLIFHLAFLIIILGAFVTRNFGKEGIMQIRENEITSDWQTTNAWLKINYTNDGKYGTAKRRMSFTNLKKDPVSFRFTFNGHIVKFKVKEFFPQSDLRLYSDTAGYPVMHLVTSGRSGKEDRFLFEGDTIRIGDKKIFFFHTSGNFLNGMDVIISKTDEGNLRFKAPFEVASFSMPDEQMNALEANEWHEFIPARLYKFGETPVVLRQYLPSGRIEASHTREKKQNPYSALIADISVDNISRQITVFGRKEQEGSPVKVELNKMRFSISYGSLSYRLPFSLRLNDFILKRYPGSKSPSWYESNVQLIDTEKGINQEKRIYMNHILRYRGYRFFQSSYDADEKGTVLSINRDGPGTFITYLGYFLLGLGFVLSLFNKKSRFGLLRRDKLNKPSHSNKLIVFMLFSASVAYGQEEDNAVRMENLPVIDIGHASAFGEILVQDNGGRIEPVNTLASEVLRKVYRNSKYKGQNPEQVLLGMITFPEQWQNEPLIKVSHPEVRKELGIESGYASYNDFFKGNRYGEYGLRQFVELAYRKKPAYRNKFDNEIIRTDERLNICYLVYTASVFKIFPDPDDSLHTWHSPLTAPGAFNSEDSVFTHHVFTYYLEKVRSSFRNKDWKPALDLVNALKTFQNKYGNGLLPSASHVKLEIFYNKASLFERLTRIYLLTGFVLLILQFISLFFLRFNIRAFTTAATIIIWILFWIHASGMGIRWYVSGHAPWSNGYEALVFIAWATVLAGLLFSGKSGFTISTTAILGALILQTAHLSWMDPQITNLVPVLKSYWLVIHVAVITASYGFLGLGALLAIVNLLLLFFETMNNRERLELNINQMTRIIELSLIVGLYLLTIGTFLGGVWANESWGRYWGWDPKETWALITIMVYAMVVHLRLVPGMRSRILFNIASLVAFGSVIMTYFGVNYYLSGLHSYATGDPVPVPPVVYYAVGAVFVISSLAAINQFKIRGALKNE